MIGLVFGVIFAQQGLSKEPQLIFKEARQWQIAADAPGSTITYDAVGSGNNGSGATTITWSHIVGTGPDRFMAIGISIRTTTVTVSSITVGEQNAVFIRGDNNATDVRGELWYLIAPNSGTQTITVTLSESSKAAGGSVSYTNVRQTAPLDNHAFKIGTSATPNVDLTVNTANAMVFINNATKYDPTVSSHDSGQTHRYYEKTTLGLLSSSRNVGDGDDKLESTTGAKNYQITISDSRDWVVQAFSFKPSQFNPVEQATLIWKLGATEVEPGGVTISRIEFTNYSDTRTTNPGGGTWTWTDINNLEVGSRATALGAAETIQVSEYWIVVDYTPPIVSVSVSDGVVTYGIMPANTSKSTLPSELNDMQTATNDGNVTENFNIKGQDATGGGCTWTLAATNGSDQYVHQFCNDTDLDCSSPPTNYIALTTTYQALDTGIAVSGTVQIQLRLTTPNPSSCYGQQSVNVTIQAVQP